MARKAEELKAKREEGQAIAATTAHAFKPVLPDEVAMAWMKVIVKRALPLDLVDEPLFREAVVLTAAKSGSKNLLVGNEVRLPHRTTMTTKILPALDAQLSASVGAQVRGLANP
eukprot:scaffold77305_cov26-Tisochrysis_lutea.AAC.1